MASPIAAQVFVVRDAVSRLVQSVAVGSASRAAATLAAAQAELAGLQLLLAQRPPVGAHRLPLAAPPADADDDAGGDASALARYEQFVSSRDSWYCAAARRTEIGANRATRSTLDELCERWPFAATAGVARRADALELSAPALGVSLRFDSRTAVDDGDAALRVVAIGVASDQTSGASSARGAARCRPTDATAQRCTRWCATNSRTCCCDAPTTTAAAAADGTARLSSSCWSARRSLARAAAAAAVALSGAPNAADDAGAGRRAVPAALRRLSARAGARRRAAPVRAADAPRRRPARRRAPRLPLVSVAPRAPAERAGAFFFLVSLSATA